MKSKSNPEIQTIIAWTKSNLIEAEKGLERLALYIEKVEPKFQFQDLILLPEVVLISLAEKILNRESAVITNNETFTSEF